MATYSRRSSSSNGLLVLLLLLLLGLVLLLFVCRRAQRDAGAASTPAAGPAAGSPERLEVPTPLPGDELVAHEGYSLGYRNSAEQAAWVAYLLTAAEVASPNTRRSNNFRPDPAIPSGTADNRDYEGSGYDRGHLVPAEDLSYSPRSMSESFYYSNMSPQSPAFNRGVWRRLEELVRYWATAYDSIYVVSGPVLEPGLRIIGPHHVAVPQRYYKVILQYSHGGAKAIGFLLNNEPSAATLKSFAVSVDSVEQVTGIDFFPQLPDETELELEGRYRVEDWRWTREKRR
ncbi:MAG: DNA/RNA non-specific endonuclease [Chitinophagaceae bacterium]|nr:MAG: DNA/RNA non-specific endonuclease [Chitinophagaceae bacterium]